MQMVRSARRAGRLSMSAADAASTVSMFICWQARITRRAISPRLATSTRLIGKFGSSALVFGPQLEQRHAVFDELAVGHADFGDDAFDARLHGVEQLHHFDQAD